jgi:ribosome biogenesis GTPase A
VGPADAEFPATIESVAHRVASLAGQSPALTERARRLADRCATRRFHVAVLGEFKRGKSTLVNALVGSEVLPTGVVPVTTVATEVHLDGGGPAALVVFDDGSRREVPPDELGRYVSEQGNPANRLGVRRVEVHVETPLPGAGVVLVDTPGVASVSDRQSDAAAAALADSDGWVVVLSVDSPLSHRERDLVAAVAGRGGRVFVVVNKCDHVTPAQTEELGAYLAPHLTALLGRRPHLYFMSARRALDAAIGGAGLPAPRDPGFDRFRLDLETFLSEELGAARDRAAAAELSRLTTDLSEAVAIERAAVAMDLAVLQERLDQFTSAAADVRVEFAHDQLVLAHEVAQIGTDVRAALAHGTAAALELAWPLVTESVAGLHGRALDRGLDDAVARALTRAFEPLRHAAETTADTRWRESVARSAERLRRRVLSLRAAAASLFEVHLPDVPLPTVGGETERFSYLFVQVRSPASSVARTLRTMLPGERARRGVMRDARKRMASELDKHAGRAASDLVQRLDAAARRFASGMNGELEHTVATILAAAVNARQALQSTDAAHRARDVERARALQVVTESERVLGTLRQGSPS